ncbi:hypothetical protein [Sphingopyxis sp.]|uniref:hypothetical protein n=1 Tax=Sphingopyxis sp. TaxID=1908224 RepID=UPI002FCAE8ED
MAIMKFMRAITATICLPPKTSSALGGMPIVATLLRKQKSTIASQMAAIGAAMHATPADIAT